MYPLLVGIEQLEADLKLLSFQQFGKVMDVILHNVGTMVSLGHIARADAEILLQDHVERLVEGEAVVGHIHVTVVIDPVRKNRANRREKEPRSVQFSHYRSPPLRVRQQRDSVRRDRMRSCTDPGSVTSAPPPPAQHTTVRTRHG